MCLAQVVNDDGAVSFKVMHYSYIKIAATLRGLLKLHIDIHSTSVLQKYAFIFSLVSCGRLSFEEYKHLV